MEVWIHRRLTILIDRKQHQFFVVAFQFHHFFKFETDPFQYADRSLVRLERDRHGLVDAPQLGVRRSTGLAGGDGDVVLGAAPAKEAEREPRDTGSPSAPLGSAALVHPDTASAMPEHLAAIDAAHRYTCGTRLAPGAPCHAMRL